MLTVPVAGSPPGTPLAESWIELFNPSGSTADISGWILAASGIRAVLPRGTSLPAHGYLLLFKHDTLLELGNAPLISLQDASGALVDSVQPPLMQPGQTFARLPDGAAWAITSVPSPLARNTAAPPVTPAPSDDPLQATVAALETAAAAPLPTAPSDPSSLATALAADVNPDAYELEQGTAPKRSRKGEQFQSLGISAVRQLPDNTAVITSGAVTLPPGRFEASRGYVQAGTAGILIHVEASQLSDGQLLTIKGRVHHYHGEVEIAAVSGGLQPGEPGPEIPPVDKRVSEVGPGLDALLVRVAGRVVARGRDYVTLADGTSAVRVLLYPTLGVRPAQLSVGEDLTVAGVVNASGDEQAPYRLVPRSLADLEGAIAPVGTPLSGVESEAAPRSPGQELAAFLTATPFITPVTESGRAAGPTSSSVPSSTPLPARTAAISAGSIPFLLYVGLASAGAVSGAGLTVLLRRLRR